MDIRKDSNFMDYVICVNRKELTLVFRKASTMTKEILSLQKKPTTFAMFENRLMVVVGNETGDFIFFWDPQIGRAHV